MIAVAKRDGADLGQRNRVDGIASCCRPRTRVRVRQETSMSSTRAKLLLLMAVAGSSVLALRLLADNGVDTGQWRSAPAEVQGILWPVAQPVAEFAMRTQHDQPFGSADLLGHWSFVSFGYLQCPDVCPTTLQTLAQFHRLLPPTDAAGDEQFVFVTVDPGNDGVERLGPYLAHFDGAFTGLVGDDAQLAGFARSLSAMYAERIDSRGVRSMDHTTSIIVIDPAGRVVGSLPMPADPERLVEQYRQLRAHLES
jgi:protein SCO1